MSDTALVKRPGTTVKALTKVVSRTTKRPDKVNSRLPRLNMTVISKLMSSMDKVLIMTKKMERDLSELSKITNSSRELWKCPTAHNTKVNLKTI
jgi:hypothetical protein